MSNKPHICAQNWNLCVIDRQLRVIEITAWFVLREQRALTAQLARYQLFFCLFCFCFLTATTVMLFSFNRFRIKLIMIKIELHFFLNVYKLCNLIILIISHNSATSPQWPCLPTRGWEMEVGGDDGDGSFPRRRGFWGRMVVNSCTLVGGCRDWLLVRTSCCTLDRRRFWPRMIGMVHALSASCVFSLRLHASLPRTHNWLSSLLSASCLGLRRPAAMSDGWFLPAQAVSSANLCNAFLIYHILSLSLSPSLSISIYIYIVS